MTANVFKEDIDRCLASGMNDHLAKPIEFDAALEKNKVLRRRCARAEPLNRFAGPSGIVISA